MAPTKRATAHAMRKKNSPACPKLLTKPTGKGKCPPCFDAHASDKKRGVTCCKKSKSKSKSKNCAARVVKRTPVSEYPREPCPKMLVSPIGKNKDRCPVGYAAEKGLDKKTTCCKAIKHYKK